MNVNEILRDVVIASALAALALGVVLFSQGPGILFVYFAF
jgi:hypothetical protein